MPTGRSANSAETLLSEMPAASCARTETGTSVRTARSVGSPPRAQQLAEARRDRGEDDVVDRAAERVRISLTSVRRARARSQRRCGPIGPLSAVGAGGRTMPA